MAVPRTPAVIVRSRSPSVGIRFLGQPELEHGRLEIPRPLLVHECCSGAVPIALDTMAAEAAPLIDHPAVGDPIRRARQRGLRDLELLRLEHVAPFAAIHAELLQICDQTLELSRLSGDPDGVASKLLVRDHDDRGLTARFQRHEQQTIGIRREPDLLLAREVEQPLGDRGSFQRLGALPRRRRS